ncbi:MAG TPA: hypothetical protein VGE74_10030 [Gemmata sp.]
MFIVHLYTIGHMDMTQQDSIRELQTAARVAAEFLAHQPAARVIVLGPDERLLVSVTVPSGAGPKGTALEAEAPPAAAGWVVTERAAAFDGTPVVVAPSRLRLLRALVEAEQSLTAKELTALVFDRHTDEANTRYHIRELKRELKAAFTFDGDVIQGDGDGYRLVLR